MMPMKAVLSSLLIFFVLNYGQSLLAQPLFEPQTIDSTVQIGYGLAIGDIDGDGLSDIILADKKAYVWYRNPDWTRYTLIENITERDNVCLAARDLDGDGMVEIAVGAQWNPGETMNEDLSGSVHYLVRSAEVNQPWKAIRLPHEPTVHRMGWVKTPDGFQLVVVPLHGRGNVNGEGRGVRIYAYQLPTDPKKEWTKILVDSSMHVTHNFDIISDGVSETLIIGGKEGFKHFTAEKKRWRQIADPVYPEDTYGGYGEIRNGQGFIAGIQPFHGDKLTITRSGEKIKIISQNLQQGHGLACADFLHQGRDQLVVGWREKNTQGVMGVKLFTGSDKNWTTWKEDWIDQNGMACEDLKVSDLNGDGKIDIIAAGRSTGNLKIYWNRN